MLEVQNWLKNNHFNFSLLEGELGIKSTFNEVDNRVILNYSQIDSPKLNAIVRECRGLVLDKTNANLIARAFPRFFNWGELQHDERWFNWDDSISYSKEDGSLILSYEFNGSYHFNTRGSFGNGSVIDGFITWRELIELAEPAIAERIKINGLDNLTLVWELCSRYNQVVRIYDKPVLYLLSAYSGEQELTDVVVDNIAADLKVARPEKWYHKGVFDVFAHINAISEKDLTFEGCVVRDCHNHRWKIKCESYLKLHRLSNNGNIAHTKNLIPLILKGEAAEVVSYFPALKEQIEKVEGRINDLRKEVDNIWFCHHDAKSQKAFALAVKDHPCSSILFKARASGRPAVEIFNESAELLVKVLS